MQNSKTKYLYHFPQFCRVAVSRSDRSSMLFIDAPKVPLSVNKNEGKVAVAWNERERERDRQRDGERDREEHQ